MSLALDSALTSPSLIRLDPAYALAAHLAERHLLGYLMLNGEALRLVAEIIDPGDFEGYPHCRIYLAMETLASLGEAIDILTLSELLESDEHYQAAGGIQLLGQLAGLAGGEAAGKRLLVRLRHCAQVRMETGADAPIYHWVGEQA